MDGATEWQRLGHANADLVISWDNVARWERDFAGLNRLKAVHGTLKPGGILGVVEIRAPEGTTFRRMLEDGAATEDHVIALAEVAGFRLVSRSPINAGAAPSRMTLRFVKP